MLKLYHLKKKMSQYGRESMLTYQSNANENKIQRDSKESRGSKESVEEEPLLKKDRKKIELFDIINFATSIFFYLTLLSVSLIYLAFYAFS